MGERRDRGVQSWLLCACFALHACGSSTHGSPDLGSETNWLRECSGDSSCGEGSCVCGVCSAGCSDDADCPKGLRCQHQNSMLYAATCGVNVEVRGLCSPECERDADCAEDLACVEGACAPLTVSERDGGRSATARNASGLASERQLVIDAHLELGSDCAPDLERPIGSGVSMLDISGEETGNRGALLTGCQNAYRLNLRSRNLLPDSVLAKSAEVMISTLNGETLTFDEELGPMPNPFSRSVTGSVPAGTADQPSTGVIVAEAIPAAYAPYLRDFAGDQVAVRVQLSGETLSSGDRVRSNVFEYRVGICAGCLKVCGTELDAAEVTVDELVGDACNDNAAADGRWCVDRGC